MIVDSKDGKILRCNNCRSMIFKNMCDVDGINITTYRCVNCGSKMDEFGVYGVFLMLKKLYRSGEHREPYVLVSDIEDLWEKMTGKHHRNGNKIPEEVGKIKR